MEVLFNTIGGANRRPASPFRTGVAIPERAVRSHRSCQRRSLTGLSCNLKILLAFILGVFSFLLLFGLGAALEGASGKFGEYALTAALVIVIGAYFLSAQYFLSRGNPQALRKVWPLIIAMNFILLCAPILCLVLESKGAD